MAGNDSKTKAQLLEELEGNAEQLTDAKQQATVATERVAELEEQVEASVSTMASLEAKLAAIETRLSDASSPTPINEDAAKTVPATNGKAPAMRIFVCPQYPNGEFLAVIGEVVRIKDPNSPTGFRDMSRDGDVKVVFNGGQWTTNDENDGMNDKRLEWLAAHPDIARDVTDPTTPVWFELKQGQMETSRREATFSRSADIDAALAGDFSQLANQGGQVVENARAQVEAATAGV